MQTAHIIPQDQARRLVSTLTALGDKLEAESNPLWFAAASAAATLESLRLGICEIETFATVQGGLGHEHQ